MGSRHSRCCKNVCPQSINYHVISRAPPCRGLGYGLCVHGGHDKALYAYPFEHYSFWENLIESEHRAQKSYAYGHFGENITTSGLLEHEVWVGDLWFIGDLELRVTKLREPCYKFNAKMEYKKAAKTMIKTAKSGWYLKVIKEGVVKAGDTIKVIHGPQKISIKHQNDALLAQK